ncbi:MAG: hypothetical protein IT558_05125 [Alphaproteobacteria bacterium]|nr:hypothetical protein [Alphaproteobacteria bacterium]
MRLLLAALLLLATPAFAGEGPDFVKDNQPAIVKFMEDARAHITEAKLPDGSFVPPEQPGELGEPVIPLEEGKRVINRGILAAYLAYCDYDWLHESYIPFIEAERARGTWSDKQMAYMGLLHGVAQGSFAETFAEKGPCDDKKKKTAEKLLGMIKAP